MPREPGRFSSSSHRITALRIARAIVTKSRKAAGMQADRLSALAIHAHTMALGPRARLVALSTVGRSSLGPGLARDLLATSGLFDVEFYRAQQPTAPRDLAGAIAHFVTEGMPQLAAFHPAILPGYLDPRITQAWLRGDLGDVFRLLTVPGLKHPWAPWFSPAGHVDVERSGPRRFILADVLAFLRDLKDDTPLSPDPALSYRAPTRWLDVRAEALAAARLVQQQRALRRSRANDHWDAAAEQRWVIAVEQHPISLPDGAPLVSIVMPAWNRETVIADAIASVQAQTFTEWELVVVDDGSTDSTADVAARLAASDPRVRVLRAEHAGVCAARNAGITEARGRYVAFLDTDNSWRPRFLELTIKAMDADHLEFAYCGTRLQGSDGAVSYRGSQTNRDELLLFNHIDLNVAVVRTATLQKIGGFDPDLRRWVDHDLAIRLSAVCDPTYLPFIGCDYDDTSDGLARITTSEGDHWEFVVLGKAWCDWEAAEQALPQRVAGRVSIVMPVLNNPSMTLAAVDSVIAHSGDRDIEIIVVDNGSSDNTALALASGLQGVPQARWERLPRNYNFGIGSNVGAIRSTGSFILFLNNDTLVRSGWLEPLIARLDDSQVAGVQPVLVYADDTVQSAGTYFPSTFAIPAHFLTDFPKDAADGVGSLRFSAATAAALLMRVEDVVALRGFDPAFVNGMEDVDLCLRALGDTERYFAVEPASVVTHLESRTPGRGARIAANRALFAERWRGRLPQHQDPYPSIGLKIAHLGVDQFQNPAPRPILTRVSTTTHHAELGDIPALRWGIRNPATAGPRGDEWGDTHFCAHLVEGLRAHGQQAAATRYAQPLSTTMAYDDVSVVIRGLRRIDPQPGKINVLWVISHPELVTVEEIAAFDLVFAASTSWARSMSDLSGRPILPLLQATDPTRFHPDADPNPHSDRVLFVGQARSGGIPRKIVTDALAAEVPLEVWGPNWSELLEDDVHFGDYLHYRELPARYRRAARVLNDHWDDMAAEGFISNRVFDAVAAGGRVISDQVAGIEELFGGAVQSYTTTEELAYLCSPQGEARYPSDEELLQIARRVGEEHSFVARAGTMLAEVLKLLDER